MGYKGKSDKEYQREYYLRKQYAGQVYKREYKNDYYLKNRDRILLIKAEHYRNKVKECNKNENNVVIIANNLKKIAIKDTLIAIIGYYCVAIIANNSQ